MSLKVLYVCDATSPIARGWLAAVAGPGLEIGVFSTRSGPNSLTDEVTFRREANTAWSNLHEAVAQDLRGREDLGNMAGLVRRATGKSLLRARRRWRITGKRGSVRTALDMVNARRVGNQIDDAVSAFEPDIVHALRIPFEGIAARPRRSDVLFVASVWGNDLTLQAPTSRLIGQATTRVLSRCDGLVADCGRDLELAPSWGFDSALPTLVAPGAGGVDVDKFSASRKESRRRWGIPLDAFVVLNPRGDRPYARTETFFDAVEVVIRKHPGTIVICLGLSELRWRPLLESKSIEKNVKFVPWLPAGDLPSIYGAADVYCSPTEHDGTPNSMLEALAAGCFPVVSDLASFREWVRDGHNGRLFDPASGMSLSNALLDAYNDAHRREETARLNRSMVAERANPADLSERVSVFYSKLERTDGESQRP